MTSTQEFVYVEKRPKDRDVGQYLVCEAMRDSTQDTEVMAS